MISREESIDRLKKILEQQMREINLTKSELMKLEVEHEEFLQFKDSKIFKDLKEFFDKLEASVSGEVIFQLHKKFKKIYKSTE